MPEPKARKKPTFKRADSGQSKYKGRIKSSWRQPRGTDNKVRLKLKGYGPQPGSGYRNPRALRGKHPSGYTEILVNNIRELETLDPDVQAARIAKAVGLRKALLIQDKADELGIIILNPKRAMEEEILEEVEEEETK
ncbi:MAG: 50S ribosomal protein L32e [Candidatus Ranarchaeia archaeon]|jgi:large subunit ribosomal protein L32e